MKNLFCGLLLGLFSYAATAQWYDPEKVNKKAQEFHERGIAKLQDGQMNEGIAYVKKALELDAKFVDAFISLASAHGELRDYPGAVKYFERARELDTFYFRFFNLPYSINLAGTGRFDDALAAVNRFLLLPELNDRSRASGEYRKKSYAFAVQFQQKNPGASQYVFAPQNLGDSVNSTSSEYFPSITINDSLFVFTRRGPGFREDFFESSILPGKNFSQANRIAGDINEEPSKGAINISQDGEWLMFAGNFASGLGDFDIYLSAYTPEGWGEPENLGRNVNSEYWDSGPSISPDKKALYFSSSRHGGYGGKDLYVSYRQPNGRWGPAQNMGPSINTAGDEEAPFIHADNVTLYFSSNGLQGYGDKDIFLVRKGPNETWSIPENLGFPINTIGHEGSLFVAANGKTAYYASDRSDSRGGLDIYTFELRPEARPIRTLYVKGKVYDIKTGKGLPSGIELVDNSTRQLVSTIQTDETGHYFITLPTGKDYTFTVNRKGYLFFSELYPLSGNAPDSTYRKDIPLQPMEVNASVVLKNILFDINSATLQDISLIEINKLLQLLNENPTLKIQVNGHTDNVGKPADNLKLSEARAKAVVDYLVGKGVNRSRLAYKGFGETKPVASNNTEEGRAQNRRTEFVIVGQ